MAKPETVPTRFGPHEQFPGLGHAVGRPSFVDDLIPFVRFPPPVCVDVSIDVGTLTTAVTLNAAGGNYCFTDNVSALTDVILLNFGSGDHIEVTGASASTYSFTTVAGDPNDLSITYSNPNTGQFTLIVIDEVLPGPGFISDYASAAAAVGFDFMSFA